MKRIIVLLTALVVILSVILVACSKDKPAPKDPPACTSNTAPLNNTNVTTSAVVLTWTAATGATSYDVYVGSSAANAALVASNVTGNSYTYTVSSGVNATYYWYVAPKNSDGSASGCSSNATSFNFGTAPGCATNIEPANSSNVTTKTVTLKWSKVPNSTGYDVYIGTTSTLLNVAATNVSDTVYSYTVPASFTTTYYWYVVPKNSTGTGTGCTSSITAFTYLTAPENATYVTPVSGSPVYGNSVELKWNKVTGAANYDVYAGASANTASLIASNLTDTLYNYTLPSAPLSTTLYWYVVPKNVVGSATNSQATAVSFRQMVIKAPEPLVMPLVTYFPSYRSVTEYPDAMFKMCDVVNYAFGNVNATGTTDIASLSVFQSLYTKARANGSKVFLSIAGAANFKTMAETETGRTNFIKDLMNKVRQYGLDGIDIDWEYPRTTDGTDVTFAALMKQLSDSLHVDGKYYLTAAVTPGIYSGSVRDGIKTEIFGYVDLLMIMAYDDFTTDPNFPYKQHSSMSTATVSLNYWLNTRALPKQKCVLGIPAYGRNSGATQVSASYKTILTSGTQLGPAPLFQSDSARMTRTDGSTYTTYYNGVLTVAAKTNLAKDRANGVFFWELGHDASDLNVSLHRTAADILGKTY